MPVLSLAKIDENIKTIKKSGADFVKLVHVTGVGIIQHAMGAGNGDVTRALKLVQALPRKADQRAMVMWFANHAPIGINLKEGKVGLIKPNSPRFHEYDPEGARADKWWIDVEGERDAPNTMIGFADINDNIIVLADRIIRQVKTARVKPEDREASLNKAVAMMKLVGNGEHSKEYKVPTRTELDEILSEAATVDKKARTIEAPAAETANEEGEGGAAALRRTGTEG